MITQNWNTKTGEEKVIVKSDMGRKIEVTTIKKDTAKSTLYINGLKVPKKVIGNMIFTFEHGYIGIAKNIPKYIYVQGENIIGISEEILDNRKDGSNSFFV